MMTTMARSDGAFDVLRIFLKLGLTCFGGPIEHIGYFATSSFRAAAIGCPG
jgi:chromate transport protein ChrA